jgi:hypothetical protein
MVGAGDRSDKIRTYNFPQDRITDHRIGKTVHNLPGVIDGDLDDLIDALVMADQADGCRPYRRRPVDGGRSRVPAPTENAGELLREGVEPGAGRWELPSTPSCCLPTRSASDGLRSPRTSAHRWSRPYRYRAAIERRYRQSRSPIRDQGFYGLAFAVDWRALIPRPETERLVSWRRPRSGIGLPQAGKATPRVPGVDAGPAARSSSPPSRAAEAGCLDAVDLVYDA